MAANQLSFHEIKPEDCKIPLKTEVNVPTGAATVQVGIPISPGRDGFQPSLSLLYSSGGGNSVFGMGWNVQGIPSVTLSLKDGYSKYDGTDKFSFGGLELIPWLVQSGAEWRPRTGENDTYYIYYYRSVIDSSFTRFEKWIHKTTREVHWRVHSSSNRISVFGVHADNRISDPQDAGKIFQWLIEGEYDSNGNAIIFDYIPDNFDNVDGSGSVERNRLLANANAQKYIKRIRYGNTIPGSPGEPVPPLQQWLFELVFDYGEHRIDNDIPSYETVAEGWPVRVDPFSAYIAGFEQRTYRLCRHMLQFHHFSELGAGPMLTGCLHFDHAPNIAGTTLTTIRYTGYRRENENYQSKSLPPASFTYTAPGVESSFNPVPGETDSNFPMGLNGLSYKWIDLYGEGLPGILYELHEAWYYKPNLGGGNLGIQQKLGEKPSILPGSYALSDFDSDGNLNLVVFQGKESGFYEYNRDKGTWDGFTSFRLAPHVNSFDLNTQLIDLTGDGRADIVTIEQDRITWYPSKGKEGFGEPVQMAKPVSGESGFTPVIGANPALDFFFADMSGSGLADQVRVTNGRIEYWPNLGNGKFGTGIVMENAPQLDYNAELDSSRIRFVDLDGSGTSDLLYIGRGEITYWINACGNRFTEGKTIKGLPYIDNISSVQIIDFLGNGTPCFVWSSGLSIHAQAPIQYLQLTNGVKPRLIEQVDNNMGLETRFTYGYSAQHYLRDKTVNKPWITKLPFHHVVVDAVEKIDQVGNTRFKQHYAYHDGFYDGEERAFRGFNLVDQYDSDVYLGTSGIPTTEFTDPVCVRTWFHNGAPGWQKARSKSYYTNDHFSIQLSDFLLEQADELGPQEFFQAIRSVAGQVIRSETYSVNRDGNLHAHPFKITHANYLIRRTQPAAKKQDAGFALFPKESLEIIFEEEAGDPRIAHQLNLDHDAYGMPAKQVAISYPRLTPDALPEQRVYHIKAVVVAAGHIDLPDHYEVGIEWERKTFDIKDNDRPFTGTLYEYSLIKNLVNAAIASPVSFDGAYTGGQQAKLLQWTKNYYWNSDRSAVLLWGQAGDKVLLHHQETACFSDSFLENVLGEKNDPALPDHAHYIYHDNLWWQRGGVVVFGGASRFFLPVMDIAANLSRVEYIFDPYQLVLKQITQVLVDDEGTGLARNTTKAEIDYHICAPWQIENPNQNVAQVQYDPLGVIVLSTIFGSVLSGSGTLNPVGHKALADHVPPAVQDFEHIIADAAAYVQQCATYFYYELDTWQLHRQPLRSIKIAREDWVYDGTGIEQPASMCEVQVNYTDGFGRTIQTKILAGAGAGEDTIQYHNGSVVVDAGGEPVLHTSDVPRWIVSAHTVFNNKQQPVRRFEPYYSPEVRFEDDEILDTFGESALHEYDALNRQKRILFADGTSNHTEITTWTSRQYDANDAVVGSLYELQIQTAYGSGTPERTALEKSQAHNNTPVISHVDGMGRTFFIEESDETGRIRTSRVAFDEAGQVKSMFDARGLECFTYVRDMQGRLFHEQGVDAGSKWQFIDALDQPIHLWDARGVHEQVEYDSWNRPVLKRVDGALSMNHITERFTYGEDSSITDAVLRNLLGRMAAAYDQSGLTSIHHYDLLGNVLEKDCRLLAGYTGIPDWTHTGGVTWMEGDPFVTKVTYNALGRIKEHHFPDDTTRRYTYWPGGSINTVQLSTTDGTWIDVPVVQQTSYNARGQVRQVTLGNNVIQRYDYDKYNYRLKRKNCFRPATAALPAKQYHNISYTYDAAGHCTFLIDAAQPNGTLLFDQPRINQYTYDAFYQLIVEEGRTHQSLQRTDYAHDDDVAAGFAKGTRHISADNMALLQSYTRRYSYDLNGNMLSLVHNSGTTPGEIFRWRRDFWVAGTSNRSIERDDLNGNPVTDSESRFDENGNLVYLSNVNSVHWNYRNQLAKAVIIARDSGDDAEYYVYSGDGRRVRKVWQKLNNGVMEITEKIYLDGCEIKRIRHGDTLLLERITSDISDGSGRVALLHRWTTDVRARETDDISVKKIHYQLLSAATGSSRYELDAQGEIINYEEYFAFGESAFIYGNALRDVEIKDYRYSGKERDDATQLYYYGFRYYASWLCRWMNPDPVGAKDGVNVYLFVHNDPVNKHDEDGLQTRGTGGGADSDTASRGTFSRRWTFPGGSQVFHDRTEEHAFLQNLIAHGGSRPSTVISFGGRDYHIHNPGEMRRFWEALDTDAERMMRTPDEGSTSDGSTAGGSDPGRTEDAVNGAGGEEGTHGTEGTGGDEAGHGSGSGTGSGTGAVAGSGTGSGIGSGSGTGTGTGTGTVSGSGTGAGTGTTPRVVRDSAAALARPVSTGEGTEPVRSAPPPPPSSSSGDAGVPLDGARTGDVNSELAAGPPNPNGSVDGSAGGTSDAAPREEMAWWQTALIVVAAIAVAIAITVLTMGAALAFMGVTAATASITQLVIAGAVAGLASGLASDATSQLLTIAVSDRLTLRDYSLRQTLFSGVVGMVTGGFTAGLGGYAAAAQGAVTNGTATATQSLLAGAATRMESSLVTRALVNAGAGAVEGSGIETIRQGIFEDHLNGEGILRAGLLNAGISGSVGTVMGGRGRGGRSGESGASPETSAPPAAASPPTTAGTPAATGSAPVPAASVPAAAPATAATPATPAVPATGATAAANTVPPQVLALPLPANPRNLPVGPTGERLFDAWVGGLLRSRVTTGETSDGITDTLRQRFQDWATRYGTVDGPPIPNATGRQVQVGHVEGQAHVLSPEGTVVQVTPQTAAGNRSWSSIERALADLRRAWNAANPDNPVPVRPRGQKRN
ncbi:hypothetical protein A3860_33510 [Niastella vici]|uniref:Insecticidal toxin complex protein n=1 Tax=Niastella vici TaxID=1703345 RepID=A0A1V9FQ04_9BACT|nr:SpvB/TcaC N-terminal domain-containing protein [Niastella vici]OQP60443.1 hypothetical protein A3860_33510 [Niastella vici]